MNIHADESSWELVFGTAFPEKILNASQISELTGIDENFLVKKVGVHQRHVLGEGELALDIAEAALKTALNKAELEASDLQCLIFVTQNPDYVLPQSSSLLCDRMGCSLSVAAFDISLGCSGWVYALSMAVAFADAQGFDKTAIVTCDTYTPRLDKGDKSTMAVFGDGAAATLLMRGGDYRLGKGVFGTDGGPGFELKAEGGELNTSTGSHRDRPTIRMNGRSILEFMLTRVPDSVNECLSKNGVAIDDIDCFAFHQASEYMIRLLTRNMSLDEEKVPICINQIGNTVSSTIPILLAEQFEKTPTPNRILVCGFGVGLSWATNILFKNER